MDIVRCQMNQYPWITLCRGSLWHMTNCGICILRLEKSTTVKKNSLPSWEHYFEQLGDMEYQAYEMRQQYPQVSKAFVTCLLYHLNNQEMRNQLYCKGLNRAQFIERLEKVIELVYESAYICGFRERLYAAKESI